MSVSVTIVPSSSVQLGVIGQSLIGQSSGRQLNAIIQGTGHYWSGTESHTSGQTQSLGNIRDSTYIDIQGQIQNGTTQVQAPQTTKTHTWIRGNLYGSSGQPAITIAGASSGSAYVLNQAYTVYAGGGAGGRGATTLAVSTAGGAGASAIDIQGATTKVLFNQGGVVYGGGGGGGGGAVRWTAGGPGGPSAAGGGGGGGASFGAGGQSTAGFPGQAATASVPGQGGYHGDLSGGIYGGSGGVGGSITGAGQAGQEGNTAFAGYGASAGGAGGQGTVTFTVLNQQGGASN